MEFRKEIQKIKEERFETPAEAQEVVDKVNMHSMGPSFCPLIKEQCRTDCECFVAARVGQIIYSHNRSPRQFRVEGFYCDNAMFYHND